jgi:HD-GYP domain-containing protein (c-di-GMP phosphodiesterase class II)
MEINNSNNLLPFILRIMSARDPYARGHSDQVTELALELAKKMEFPPDQLALLEFASRIHNIGNIAISDSVLNKPTRYTEAEFSMIQQHTIMGAKIIDPLSLDPLIGKIILHHHENFDGTGYPHKLKEKQIPFEARILRIADTYEALTHQRFYRPAYSQPEALKIMEDQRPCFDPQLLEIFLELCS